MSKNWYILAVFTGREKKIESTIRRMLDAKELDSAIITDVRVPVQETVEVMKNGKKRPRSTVLYDGYVYLEMDLPDLGWKETCSELRRIDGVTGFVCTAPSARPRPLSRKDTESVQGLLDTVARPAVASGKSFELGDLVKISEGAFAGFSGKIEEVNVEKTKLRVRVEIFGRATPVEVDFSQVEKVY
ncbi:MAG: transcription termination/antitermination protein NusG [Treponema sp.]|nr:transcription termination/antitermination protein NusG [Treponema sp.]